MKLLSLLALFLVATANALSPSYTGRSAVLRSPTRASLVVMEDGLKPGPKDIEPEKTASTYLGRDLMQGQKAFEERQKAAREAGTLKFDYDKKKKFGQK